IYNDNFQIWDKKRQDFIAHYRERSNALDLLKEQYFLKIPEAIIEYYDLVLSNSKYTEFFPKDFELEYNEENKILLIEYSLPSVDQMPRVKEIKYIQSRDEFNNVFVSESEINRIYDSLIYQITLRTIYEVFQTDSVEAIDAVVFNGWVEFIDKAT